MCFRFALFLAVVCGGNAAQARPYQTPDWIGAGVGVLAPVATSFAVKSEPRSLAAGFLLVPGLGIGQAIQGRWLETGQIVLVGQLASLSTCLLGAALYNDEAASNPAIGMMVVGVVGLVGFRVFEVIDLLVGPSLSGSPSSVEGAYLLPSVDKSGAWLVGYRRRF